jgi:hypothetical protein
MPLNLRRSKILSSYSLLEATGVEQEEAEVAERGNLFIS